MATGLKSTPTQTLPPSRSATLSGGTNTPAHTCRLYRPERQAEAKSIAASPDHSVVARGIGSAYGDCALNRDGAVLDTTRLSRILSFNEDTGVLHAEAGLTSIDLIDLLLPRGWFLPVTPGTRRVTLGGMIANNVHGKNHHRDGSIANFIDDITLLIAADPDQPELVTCSRDNDAELFWATLGGLGLTGIIVSATIRLKPAPSAWCKVHRERAHNLEDALDRFDAGDDQHPYSVAWIDCLARGDRMGRAVLMRGDHAQPDDIQGPGKSRYVTPKRAQRVVPINAPGFALNPVTVGLFNKAYYSSAKDGISIEPYADFFYPLDCITHWSKLYGKRGFHQFQVAFPTATARQGLHETLNRITTSRQASFLAVLKRFGPADPSPLGFPIEGATLALDLPNLGAKTEALYADLNAITLEHDGRVYLGKDSLLDADTARKMYPRIDEFLRTKARVDPTNRFDSSLARRLDLRVRTNGADA
ncbi:MAG: FAD-binding oxidoreductase [Planctomycetota bacterium]